MTTLDELFAGTFIADLAELTEDQYRRPTYEWNQEEETFLDKMTDLELRLFSTAQYTAKMAQLTETRASFDAKDRSDAAELQNLAQDLKLQAGAIKDLMWGLMRERLNHPPGDLGVREGSIIVNHKGSPPAASSLAQILSKLT